MPEKACLVSWEVKWKILMVIFEILYFKEKNDTLQITKHYERLHSHHKNGGNKAYDYG